MRAGLYGARGLPARELCLRGQKGQSILIHIAGIDVGESEVVITTPAVANSDGVTVSVVESSDLAGETVTATEALEPEGRAEFTKSDETPRFYRLKADVTE